MLVTFIAMGWINGRKKRNWSKVDGSRSISSKVMYALDQGCPTCGLIKNPW